MSTKSGLTIKGGESLLKRLARAERKSPDLLDAATHEAVEFLLTKAREILDNEIYSKSDTQGDASESDSLYQSFVQQVVATGTLKRRGNLQNTSDHAGFIEDGTDNEGTGKHFVPIVNGGVLAWKDAATGESVFSKKGHEVQGITPIRFMHRALRENEAEIFAIYRKHFKALWR